METSDKQLNSKKQESYIEKIIWASISQNKEFVLLDLMHKYYFKGPISNDYLNYALDIYNTYKNIYNRTNQAKYRSLESTINKMLIDYLKINNKL